MQQLLRAAAQAASTDTVRPYLHNIKITDDGITAHIRATDGLVAFYGRCPTIFGKTYTVQLPAAPIRKAKKSAKIHLFDSYATVGDVMVTYDTETTFPNVERFIPRDPTGTSSDALAYGVVQTLHDIGQRLGYSPDIIPNGMDPWLVTYTDDAFAIVMPQRQRDQGSQYYKTLTNQ